MRNLLKRISFAIRPYTASGGHIHRSLFGKAHKCCGNTRLAVLVPSVGCTDDEGTWFPCSMDSDDNGVWHD